eukprot:GHVS01007492.1.p1 GENE.GHVS01007492.1~~GHVS01007492.1.p1  ORF type:complete len:502 (-),score=95.91 GHVS01007492.1:465-1853(-)
MDTTNLLKISKLYGLARTFIPLLRDDSAHRVKGFFGKIAVVGGSLEYTGAPYFAAITALRMGYDISHVFCTMNASAAIKSYSPELIVHPILFSGSENQQVVGSVDESASAIISWLPRVNVVVVGPGLSRDVGTLAVAEKVIAHARSIEIPIVLDADALILVETNPDLIKGYTRCVLTPNRHEFSRMLETLSNTFGSHVEQLTLLRPSPAALVDEIADATTTTTDAVVVDNSTTATVDNSNSEVVIVGDSNLVVNGSPTSDHCTTTTTTSRAPATAACASSNNNSATSGEEQLRRVNETEHLSRLLGNVCVVQKGDEDIITNGFVTAGCNARGAPKRSGGQGDVLSGAIAALLGWFERACKKEEGGVGPAELKQATESFESYIISYRLIHLAPFGWWRELLGGGGGGGPDDITEAKQMVAAAFGGAFLTRAYARDAFAQKERSMSVPDMIEQIPAVAKKLFFM